MAKEKIETFRNAVNKLKVQKGYTNRFLAEKVASNDGRKIPDGRMSNILNGKESGNAAFEILSDIVFLYDLELEE